MDKLRSLELHGISMPAGTPIRYNGEEIGKVMCTTDNGCMCIINSDKANFLIKNNKVSFSVEARDAKI